MMSTRSPIDAETRTLLNVTEVADMLGCSVRHIWSLNRRKILPEPIRLGRCVRWSRASLLSWLELGCPVRTESGRGSRT
ncbi:MAG: helix-turn-helix domain-containing protein [Planctomycetes bacterium]|nr:helix-turn-helix domain-containing protein [Planctomycetota bacterium]